MTDPITTPTLRETFAGFATQIIRTIVPFLVGLIAAALLNAGFSIPSELQESVSASLVVTIGSLYYVAIAALEKKFPKFGWFLGVASQPHYDKANKLEG